MQKIKVFFWSLKNPLETHAPLAHSAKLLTLDQMFVCLIKQISINFKAFKKIHFFLNS